MKQLYQLVFLSDEALLGIGPEQEYDRVPENLEDDNVVQEPGRFLTRNPLYMMLTVAFAADKKMIAKDDALKMLGRLAIAYAKEKDHE